MPLCRTTTLGLALLDYGKARRGVRSFEYHRSSPTIRRPRNLCAHWGLAAGAGAAPSRSLRLDPDASCAQQPRVRPDRARPAPEAADTCSGAGARGHAPKAIGVPDLLRAGEARAHAGCPLQPGMRAAAPDDPGTQSTSRTLLQAVQRSGDRSLSRAARRKTRRAAAHTTSPSRCSMSPNPRAVAHLEESSVAADHADAHYNLGRALLPPSTP